VALKSKEKKKEKKKKKKGCSGGPVLYSERNSMRGASRARG
jgi:hypothetical protein